MWAITRVQTIVFYGVFGYIYLPNVVKIEVLCISALKHTVNIEVLCISEVQYPS